jgi:hypothetical protein
MRIKRAFNYKRITFAGCMARPRSASGFLLGNLGGNAQRTRHTFTKAFVEADFHEGGAKAIAISQPVPLISQIATRFRSSD